MAMMPNPNIDVPANMRNFNEPFIGSAVSESDEYEARVSPLFFLPSTVVNSLNYTEAKSNSKCTG